METQVVLVKVAFGRYRMLAQIGDTVLKHVLLFPPEYEARARVQADRIDRLLKSAPQPLQVLNPKLWEGEGASAQLKARIFKPQAARSARPVREAADA